jgi:hypothetical protein
VVDNAITPGAGFGAAILDVARALSSAPSDNELLSSFSPPGSALTMTLGWFLPPGARSSDLCIFAGIFEEVSK